MAQHLAAWFENQDGAGTLQNLAALADTLTPLLPRDATGDLLRVPSAYPGIAWVYAGIDATVQPRARLSDAPSFRKTYGRAALELPKLSSTVEPGSPPVVNDFRKEPIRLSPGEYVGVQTINNPAAAADQYVLASFCDGPLAAVSPAGGFWARFITTAAAMTADTWNNRALTQDENLSEGTYEVLAMRPISTTCIAARLVFANQVNRPGVLGTDTRTDVTHAMFEPGEQGVLGRFDTQTFPSVDFLVDAADNEVQVVDLYIRPVGKR
jgi:hypothetical protein